MKNKIRRFFWATLRETERDGERDRERQRETETERENHVENKKEKYFGPNIFTIFTVSFTQKAKILWEKNFTVNDSKIIQGKLSDNNISTKSSKQNRTL